MDSELACHELLTCQHQWFDRFQSLDPLAKPFFRLRTEAISMSEVFKYPLT